MLPEPPEAMTVDDDIFVKERGNRAQVW